MDIFSARGQVYQKHSEDAVRLFEACHGNSFGVLLTDWRQPAAVDAVVFNRRTQNVCGVVEIKSREIGLDDLYGAFNGEWLITLDKLTKAKEVAAGLGVPLVGFLYLIHDGILLTQRLSDETGMLLNVTRTATTQTQRTCNGGFTERVNAFIDMKTAKVIGERRC